MTDAPEEDGYHDDEPDDEWDPINTACHFARNGVRVTSLVRKKGWRHDWPELSSTNISDVVQDFDAAIRRAGSSDDVYVGWALGMQQFMALDIDTPDKIGVELQAVLDLGGYGVNRTSKPWKYHAIYRMPDGMTVSNSDVKFPKRGWGEVRGFHGVIAIAGPDRPGFDVAELAKATPFPRPEWLGDFIAGGASASSAEVTEFLLAHTGTDAMPRRLETLLRYGNDETWSASRQIRAMNALMWGMRDARAGMVPAALTVAKLREQFLAAVVNDVERAKDWPHPERDFDRLVARAVGLANEMTDEDVLHRRWAAWEAGTIGAFFMGNGSTHDDAPPDDDAASGDDTRRDENTLPRPIDWQAFVNRDQGDRRWLVEGFWPWGRAMALWAAAKQGKSELALWCVANLALGRHPWTGKPIEPIDIAYFDYEMTEDDLDERLSAFDIDPLLLGHLHYWSLPLLSSLDTEKGGQEVEQLVREFGAQAAVIDTFGRAVHGEEDKADTVQAFYRYTGMRLKAAGVGYLRTDHAGKDTSKGQRGSSAKRDDVDVIWSQSRTNDGVSLDCSGSTRVGWVGPRLKLDRVTSAEGVISYSTPVQFGWPANVIAKAQQLDQIGLPLDAGRPAAVKALRHAGLVAGDTNVIVEALRYRRERHA